MKKVNCWEFKKCGREKGGDRVSELGICPSAEMARADGLHDGQNGGRVCWAIAGTFCNGKIQGSFVTKVSTCISCDFYQMVSTEEGDQLITAKLILEKLN